MKHLTTGVLWTMLIFVANFGLVACDTKPDPKAEKARQQLGEFTETHAQELGEAIADFDAEIERRRLLLEEYVADLKETLTTVETDQTYINWKNELDSLGNLREELITKRNELYLQYKRLKLEPDGERKDRLTTELEQAKVLAKQRMDTLRSLAKRGKQQSNKPDVKTDTGK